MKIQRILLQIVLVGVLFTLLSACQVDPIPSASDIRKIKLNMTSEQVESIIGIPGEVSINEPYTYYCNGQEFEVSVETETYAYSNGGKPGWWFGTLWVHFNEEGVVREVYAKRYYYLLDDQAVYALSNCDTAVYEHRHFGETFPD